MNASNAESCENCGRSLMASDAICWHCGWRVRITPDEIHQSGDPADETSSLPTLQFRQAVNYILFTIAIAIALLLVIRSLSRHPLLVSNVEAPLESGWAAIVDTNRRFTFELPADWSWQEGSEGRATSFDQKIAGQLPLDQLLAPCGESPAELQVLFIAFDNRNRDQDSGAAFAIVARDTRASQLSPEEAIDRLQQDSRNWKVLRAILTRDIRRQSLGEFEVEHVSSGYRCEQRLVNGSRGNFLIAACAHSVRFLSYADILAAIANSFASLPG